MPEESPLPTVLGLADLRRGITAREPMADNAGKSGARIERVTIDGERYVLKYLDRTGDWTMRAAGVLGGATLELWSRGLLDRSAVWTTSWRGGREGRSRAHACCRER